MHGLFLSVNVSKYAELANSLTFLSLQLDESLYEFLLSRNDGDEAQAVEDGYNLVESTRRLAHEPHVLLFGQIVRGELSEGVFHHWLTTQTMLTETFHTHQKEEVS